MATTGERLRTYWSERQLDRGQLVSLATRYWQVALIVAIIALAAGLRLWDLGERAVHHDESIHVKFAYDITQNGIGQYIHDPVYHGPLQYFGTAAVFRLPFFGGDSDYTSRLLPALFGIALVGLPFFLRKQLGTLGAFVAAGLLAISPVLWYFSRFARNDIYVAFFTLAIVIAIWRFMADRSDGSQSAGEESPAPDSISGFWRYLVDNGYLWLIALGPLLALSFAAKEVTYITVAVLLIYLNFMVATDLVRQFRSSRELTPGETAIAYAILLLTAWAIVILWPLIEGARKRYSFSEMPAAGPPLLVLGTISAAAYSAGVQQLPFIDDQGYQVASEQNLMRITVLVLIIGGAYVGLLWNWRVWLLAAALFYLPFVLLFTSFFTNMGGFWTGIWGSMDYWLGQQLVRRGDQPDYYYLMLLPVYELLPLVFALGGSLYYAFRGKLEHRLLAGAALLLVLILSLLPDSLALIGDFRIQAAFVIVIGTTLFMPMEGFTKFLLFWTLSILFGLTVAGEKMPWLTVHLALPMALLAAKVLADVFSSLGEPAKLVEAETPPVRRRGRGRAKKVVVEAFPWKRLAPLAYGGGPALIAAIIFWMAGPGSLFSILAWLFTVAAVGVILWVGSQVSWRTAGQVAAVGLFAALLVFTVQAGATAAFDQGDPDGAPPELLIYAQGSPKLGIIRDNIDELAKESGLGRDLKIVLDNTINIWPWPWYLREYRNVQYTSFDDTFVPEAGSVILVNVNNQQQLEPYLDDYREGIPYTHMWWFPEIYRGLETDQFLGDLVTGGYNNTWGNYLFGRDLPGSAPSADMLAYFPTDFTPVVPPPPATDAPADALPRDVQTITGGSGEELGQFSQPADMAMDSEGNLYVVDTRNQRVQKIAADGSATSVGEVGSGQGEFANPGESGDFAPDGPWGIAVDSAGNIYVADTWNHRIQKFDSDFQFITDWGAGEFFGPRDIAIDADGNLLVVDTGNKRIVKYTTDGQLIEVIGRAGRGNGEYNEPTSISVTANGDIYVADFWNRRIQHFNRDFQFVKEISVDTWGSQGVTDRAYIFALDDGTVLATDPANGRILVYDPSGEQQAAWRLTPQAVLSRPVGIIVDAQDQVYISDGFTSEVRIVPLSALLAPPAPEDDAAPTQQ